MGGPGEGIRDLSAPAELEDHVSQNLVCPISHRVMDQPVISPSGHTYDRASILEWLALRPVDPLSLVPLTPAALYPNRALQDEIACQLERLAARAAAAGDPRLAEAAKAKLKSVGAAKVASQKETVEFAVVSRLDRWVGRCASWSTWWGVLAWEQLLMFTTSFGALLCLAVDVSGSFRRGARDARPPSFLSTFIRLSMSPLLPPPRHWRLFGRVAVAALRCMLFLSVGPLCLTLTMGSVLSLTRFGQRCAEVRAVELERATQSRWFLRALQACSAVTGFSSLALFVQLYLDHCGWRR